MRKLYNSPLKCTFFGQNGYKTHIELWVAVIENSDSSPRDLYVRTLAKARKPQLSKSQFSNFSFQLIGILEAMARIFLTILEIN